MMLWLPASIRHHYIDGLVQEIRNCSANALQLRLSSINPSICMGLSSRRADASGWLEEGQVISTGHDRAPQEPRAASAHAIIISSDVQFHSQERRSPSSTDEPHHRTHGWHGTQRGHKAHTMTIQSKYRIHRRRHTDTENKDHLIIGSDNGLAPSWRQAIIWTNDDWYWLPIVLTLSHQIQIDILSLSIRGSLLSGEVQRDTQGTHRVMHTQTPWNTGSFLGDIQGHNRSCFWYKSLKKHCYLGEGLVTVLNMSGTMYAQPGREWSQGYN